jgi:hypothetical protein
MQDSWKEKVGPETSGRAVKTGEYLLSCRGALGGQVKGTLPVSSTNP